MEKNKNEDPENFNIYEGKEFFSAKVLNAGFITALILAGLCLLISSLYMLKFQLLTSSAVNEVISSTMNQIDSGSAISNILNENFNDRYNMIRLALSTHMYVARILLLSCGILVGMAFGFLGFSLFLVGVKGNIDTELSADNRYKVQIARLSPGLFVILCSTILIGICATRSLPVTLNQKPSNEFDYFFPETLNSNSHQGTIIKDDTTGVDSAKVPVLDTIMPN